MMRRRRWLIGSLLTNVVLVTLGLVWWVQPEPNRVRLAERHEAGDRFASDKIAVVRISGALLEGLNEFAFAQIEAAATDPAVKAVVVRVESPGGTIGASERLHQALTNLRLNTPTAFTGTGPKPVVASFGSIAASGGYYLAMPAQAIYAESTTITGSIGVFAALPNVAELADRNGIKLTIIKAGAIKAGASPFHVLSPADRQPWQDIVDQAYERFLSVVTAGRPSLTRDRLTEPVLPRTFPGLMAAGIR